MGCLCAAKAGLHIARGRGMLSSRLFQLVGAHSVFWPAKAFQLHDHVQAGSLEVAPASLATLQPAFGSPAGASLTNRLVPAASGEVAISASFAGAQVSLN